VGPKTDNQTEKNNTRHNITLPLGSRPREFDMSSTAIVWWSVVAFLSFAVVLLVVGSWYIVTKPVDNGVRNLDSAMWVHDEADLVVYMRTA